MAVRDLGLIVGQRLWQALAGVVTILFVVRFLSAEEQGWYYTFVSVAALYSIFEMGLAAALIQTSAHLFGGLRWQADGGVAGISSRAFESFVARGVRVYLWVAGAFVLAALTLGCGYFAAKSGGLRTDDFWLYPWLVVVLVTAANMGTLPFFAIVEGSGALSEVYGVRLLQGVAGALACWAILASGGALWAAAAVPGMGGAVAAIWLFRRRSGLGLMALKPPIGGDFDWRAEIWPLQWRIGVSWIGAYLMSQLCTPILFYYRDATVAGQMGLSLTIAHMLGILAQSSFVRSVVPMSRAVAERDWEGLDRIFRKSLLSFVILFGFGTGLVGIGYRLLEQTAYSHRMLPIEQLAALLVFVFFYQLNAAFATQVRAFRREPLAWVSAVGAALIVSGSFAVAERYSAGGVIAVMLAVQLVVVFPLSLWIWRQRIAQWREG
jgi:hypothetical protein